MHQGKKRIDLRIDGNQIVDDISKSDLLRKDKGQMMGQIGENSRIYI